MGKMNRRKFLKTTCKACSAMAAAAAFSKLGMIDAYAQGVSGFQALVCIFLFGGNDSNNLLMANDTAGFAAYNTARGPVLIPQAQVLNLNYTPPNGTQPYTIFGVHPTMPEVQTLFNSKNIAFVCNAGTLVTPTTKAQYTGNKVALPSNLFSHSDQQNQWQTGAVNSYSTTGWGGRMADVFINDNPTAGASAIPSIISLDGAPIFGSGSQTQQMAIGTGTVAAANCNTGKNSPTCLTNEQSILSLDSGAGMIAQASVVTGNAFNYANVLSADLAGAHTFTTPTPAVSNSLVSQFLQVAKVLSVNGSLGMKRQVFFLSLGGFDTHTSQGTFDGNTSGLQTTKSTGTQPYLLQQLSQGLNYFWNLLAEISMQNAVTTFTVSDFSRTFKGNNGLGSDHGWGSHHIVMSGAPTFAGGQLYGTYPTLTLGGTSDADTNSANGRWIPTTGMAQYGATLASWFGVQPGNLATIFPEYPNFNSQKLGFI